MADAIPAAARTSFTGRAWALLAYFALFAAITAPFWLHGEVIAPDRRTAALGLDEAPAPGRMENRFFNDYGAVFLPEVDAALHAPRSGWLATWSPYNELGRALYHDSALSPAYLGTRVLTLFTGDAARLYTWHSLLTLLVGGLFAGLLAREHGLGPWPALVAAVTLALTPVTLYWLSFPLFHAVPAWTAGALLAATRLARRPGPGAWVLLAFCLYSLLMTGYQQDIVIHAWLMAAYGAFLLHRTRRADGGAAAWRLLAMAGSAAVLGASCALPVYLDLAQRAGESARAAVDPGFFLANLPDVGSLAAAGRYATDYFFQDLFGVPVSPRFPHGTQGMMLAPVVLALLVAAGATTRRGRGWTLAVAVAAVLTFWPPAFRFAVAHLGFHLSHSIPLYSAQIPLAMLAAHGLQALLARDPASKRALAAALLAALALAGIALLAWRATQDVATPRWIFLALLPLAGVAVATTRTRAAAALPVALLLVSAWLHGRPLMLSQPPEAVARTSPLVADIRRHLPPGGRYAIVGDTPVLGPNINASLGLPSVHTYNSLSSLRYQALVHRLGGDTAIYGRHNRSLAPDFDSADFRLSGIALVLSPDPIAHPRLRPLRSSTALRLYAVRGWTPCCLRLPASTPAADAVELGAADLDGPRVAPATDQGDRLRFALAPAADATLLVTDRAFHPQWHAEVTTDDGTRAAATVAANDAFLAVGVPSGAQSLTLSFRPWVRYAWLGHAVFLLLSVALGIGGLRRLASRAARRAVPRPPRSPVDR